MRPFLFLPVLVLCVVFAASGFAQTAPTPARGDAPEPGAPISSPDSNASAILGGKTVSIKYSSPSMRGRKIVGGLVPYGQVWRTGANAATTMTAAADLMIGNLSVPAGTYTIYTLPNPNRWMLIVNKQTGQWGTVYTDSMDLGRVAMQSKKLDKPQEVMSISFENLKGKTVEMHVRWESTDEWVLVTAR